jgi:hypothetical protein
MKFVSKFFSNEDPSWKNWVLNASSPLSLTPQSGNYLWNIINDELNTFRFITRVKVQDGVATSFWFDHWLDSGPLHSTYSALFSHTTRLEVSVQYVFQHDFELHLRPRLTTAANQQLCALLHSLQDIDLVAGHDIRFMKHTGRPYSSKAAYTTLDCAGEEGDPHGKLVWETHVPNKVKIFAWLYLKNRLSTRCALFAKHIVNGCTCEWCDAANEDRHHVFFGALRANVFGLLSVWRVSATTTTKIFGLLFSPRTWTPCFGHLCSSRCFGESGTQGMATSSGLKVLVVVLFSLEFEMI